LSDPSGHSGSKRKGPNAGGRESVRRFRSRGIDVEIREAPERVELVLDGHTIPVTKDVDGYHSQLANQFTAFPTIDHLAETLLENEGRTWTLHGELREEYCCDEHRAGGHDHEQGHPHGHGSHDHGGGG